MEFSIEVDTYDRELLTDQIADTPPDGLKIAFHHRIVRKGIGFPDTLVFTVTIAATALGNIALNVIAAWLYDRLKNGRAEKLSIDRTIVEINEGEIRKVIHEKIRKG